jgi:3-oxoacyl-[acyl-carrier protein] reductase
MTLSDRIAIITGATQGIGRATAFALGRQGAAVGICARTEARVAATVTELMAAGIQAVGFPCDVSEPGEVAAFAAHVRTHLGSPDILVNNAGIGRFGPLTQMALEDWDAVFDTNVRSLFLVTREFLPDMFARGRGDIVNVASLGGRNAVPEGTAYAASKHAVLGFSKSLLLETRRRGIRVVAVCPGSVDTPFFDSQDTLHPDRTRILRAEDVAASIVHAVSLPPNATVSELDIRPANP